MDPVLSQGVLKMMLVASTKEGSTVTAAATYYSSKYYRVLGTFVKLRKATISFVISVCLKREKTNKMQQLHVHY